MPSLSFEKCDCGIQLKIMKLFNDHKQRYACECGREIAITGTILDLHYSRGDNTAADSVAWTKAPHWRLRDAD